jgi:transcriptional regulator with XRE-family HTH domain
MADPIPNPPDSVDRVSPLRQARLSRGLTLAEVAEGAKLDSGHLSRIERGESTTADVAERLAKFFGHSVTEMQILYPERYS